MKPEGHFVTAVAAGIGAYVISHSINLSAACFFGGFLIDLDHYMDYVLFEKQYSLNPFRFLRYYLEGHCQRVILVLHSIELMGLLTICAALTRSQILIGYLIGAAMHLVLDIIYNGSTVLRRPLLFYFFTYRALNQFAADKMIDPPSQDARSKNRIRVSEPESPA